MSAISSSFPSTSRILYICHPPEYQPIEQCSLEASPSLFDFLVGNALGSRPGFHGGFAILGDGLFHDPAGNGVRGDWKLKDCNHHDDADHLPSMTLTPSHTAPTKPVTIMVMMALNV